ncbi:MAG: (2E,6E)-farnesyl diphosphate synthase [Gammaproteobacteria bacterium]|nr:(2E,6E)-farnesyl diphosphate synthase [Gammaproteobacteria bacterium]
MPTEDLDPFTERCRSRIEQALDQRLPTPVTLPAALHQAMRYAALSGGKYVRPLLVYATGQLFNVPAARLDAPACAVELIHAYSLVHDDLPAMDDDDLRRGKPTCHKAFDEATAILAGDALQSLAFQILATDPALDVPAFTRLEMIRILAEASGSQGMACGQAMDLAAEGQRLTLAELENMHLHKTGALIRASVRLGALASEHYTAQQLLQLDDYARHIGLAFQIRDDILDIEGETEVIGKPQGSDIARNKSTYPALLGIDQAKLLARDLHNQALVALEGFDDKAETLRSISQYIVQRAR